MRKSRFTEQQIISMTREHDARVATTDLCRRHGLSEATFYKYKAKFGVRRPGALHAGAGKWPPEAAPSRCDAGQRGTEGPSHKKLLTPDVKRRAVQSIMADHGLSERRACRLADLDRWTYQYEKQAGGDEPLRGRLRELAGERRLFGYRRLGILLAREGLEVNHNRLYRIYAEERLAVQRRKGRKRAVGTGRPMTQPTRPNERWNLDFVSDAPTNGRRFRVLCVVDNYTREALAVMPEFSISGLRLVVNSTASSPCAANPGPSSRTTEPK